jgi:hypothetical protein
MMVIVAIILYAVLAWFFVSTRLLPIKTVVIMPLSFFTAGLSVKLLFVLLHI